MKIKNIFFDFDGVIAESVNVKTRAFYQMYEKFGKDIAEKVVAHHKSHGGMSRFEKFKLYHKNFLNIDLTEDQIHDLASRFSGLVKQGVIDAPEVPGVRDFLEKYHRIMNFWIISGTPTDEIRDIVKQKNMGHFFKECFGSPRKKNDWVKELMKQYHLQKTATVFVGDAKSDYQAALDNEIGFILRETPEGQSIFQDINVPRFSTFPRFERILEML